VTETVLVVPIVVYYVHIANYYIIIYKLIKNNIIIRFFKDTN